MRHINGSLIFNLITVFLKKIAMVTLTNEPRSEPRLAWKKAAWVQETCLLIQATLFRADSFYFHKGQHTWFTKDYEHLFGIPNSARIDHDASGLSPTYISSAG